MLKPLKALMFKPLQALNKILKALVLKSVKSLLKALNKLQSEQKEARKEERKEETVHRFRGARERRAGTADGEQVPLEKRPQAVP